MLNFENCSVANLLITTLNILVKNMPFYQHIQKKDSHIITSSDNPHFQDEVQFCMN